jgi:hypothetical protein
VHISTHQQKTLEIVTCLLPARTGFFTCLLQCLSAPAAGGLRLKYFLLLNIEHTRRMPVR